ncbi:hypothetical protein M0R72_14345 [Candidatus Pacearchaeota archaeon]|jgi:hypothetical protein|nr:hypothetical protein [Candidatus Pacearchaeota archaeon]
MGCGQRANYKDAGLVAQDVVAVCKYNLAQMAAQLSEAQLATPQSAAQLGRCAVCLAIAPVGYCGILAARPDLRDCQARWDAWQQVIVNGCDRFVAKERIAEVVSTQKDIIIMSEERQLAEAPSEPGMYWAQVNLPKPVAQPAGNVPRLSVLQTSSSTKAYNCILVVLGEKWLAGWAMPIPEVQGSLLGNWQRIVEGQIVAVGPKVEVPHLE